MIIFILKFVFFVTILTLIYGSIYKSLNSTGEDFSKITDDFDYYYFSLVVTSATGFGDIVPISRSAKIVVCSQMYIFWVGTLILTLNEIKHFG